MSTSIFGMIFDVYIYLCPTFGCLDKKMRTKQTFELLKGLSDRLTHFNTVLASEKSHCRSEN